MTELLMERPEDCLLPAAIKHAQGVQACRQADMLRALARYRGADAAAGDRQPHTNYRAYIADMHRGLFLGKPVRYTAAEEARAELERVQAALDGMDEQAHNQRLAFDMGVCGIGAEALYLDASGRPAFRALPPWETVFAYDMAGSGACVGAYRFLTRRDYAQDGAEEQLLHLYLPDSMMEFVLRSGVYEPVRTLAHGFAEVPLIEYPNNVLRENDFTRVEALIDCYNDAQRMTHADMANFTNALLLLIGVDGTSRRELDEIARQGAVSMPEGGDARWLTKEVNDAFIETYKERLRRDIQTISQTPDLSDERFLGNESGVAMAYKLWGAELIASQKESAFRHGLKKRLRLLCGVLFDGFDDTAITPVFSRNVPVDLDALAGSLQKLDGLVSRRTLRAMLPFVDDPAYEKTMLGQEENNGDQSA